MIPVLTAALIIALGALYVAGIYLDVGETEEWDDCD